MRDMSVASDMGRRRGGVREWRGYGGAFLFTPILIGRENLTEDSQFYNKGAS